jgi:hypothetical protein
VLLEGVGAPPDDAAGGEGGGEQVAGQAAAGHGHRRVPLDVGAQHPVGFELGQRALHLALHLDGELPEVAADVLDDAPQQLGAGVGGAVDGVAETHDPLAAGDGVAHPGGGVGGRADGVERVERPAGRPAVQRPRQRAEGGDHGRAQVGAGRRDRPGHERGGVEAVVDAEDQVLLDGPHVAGVDRRCVAEQHVQVVGGVAQVGAGRHRLGARPQPVEGGDQGGGGGGEPQGVGPQPGPVDVERRGETLHGGQQRQARAQPGHRRGDAAGDAGQGVEHGGGEHPPRRHLGHERRALVDRGGQLAVDQQVPHVLERAALGQLRRRVLAVVVEALGPPHVAEGGLGHDHALQTRGRRHGQLVGRPQVGERHQVPQRDNSLQLVANHHGDVAVAVVGELLPGLVDGGVGVDALDLGHHPVGDRRGGGVGGGGRGPQQVALGDDPDGPVALHDHQRADAVGPHPLGGLVQGLTGQGGDDRLGHDGGDGAGGHGAIGLPGRTHCQD